MVRQKRSNGVLVGLLVFPLNALIKREVLLSLLDETLLVVQPLEDLRELSKLPSDILPRHQDRVVRVTLEIDMRTQLDTPFPFQIAVFSSRDPKMNCVTSSSVGTRSSRLVRRDMSSLSASSLTVQLDRC